MQINSVLCEHVKALDTVLRCKTSEGNFTLHLNTNYFHRYPDVRSLC